MRTTVPTSGALHFSTRGEYGVRLMVELARHHGSGPVSISEMAEHEALPRPYLEQLVVSLRQAGLVMSTRGAHGGYALARPAREITVREVIAAAELETFDLHCVTHPIDDVRCSDAQHCSIRPVWVLLRNKINDVLDSVTLNDLLVPEPAVRERVGLPVLQA